MPYLLDELVVDRVDLVDDGCCSAAFIELYKRKELNGLMGVKDILSKMKPEHASVLSEAIEKAKTDVAAITTERDEALQNLAKANSELEQAKADLAAANDELAKAKEKLEEEEKAKTGASFDESEVLKSLPEAAREAFIKMKQQKEAAEEEIRKAKEAEQTAQAIAKANELKALPVEHDKLVSLVKRADAETIEMLTTISKAIESTVLSEVGKSHTTTGTKDEAWAKIEAKADEVAKRDNITKAKAVSVVIKECPELYKEYLDGGAN